MRTGRGIKKYPALSWRALQQGRKPLSGPTRISMSVYIHYRYWRQGLQYYVLSNRRKTV
jgi:hypothetical protein